MFNQFNRLTLLLLAAVCALGLSACTEFQSPTAPLSQAVTLPELEGHWFEYGTSGTRYSELTVSRAPNMAGLLKANFKGDPKSETNKEDYSYFFYPARDSNSASNTLYLNIYSASATPETQAPDNAKSFYLKRIVIAPDKQSFTLYDVSEASLKQAKSSGVLTEVKTESTNGAMINNSTQSLSKWLQSLKESDWTVYYIYKKS